MVSQRMPSFRRLRRHWGIAAVLFVTAGLYIHVFDHELVWDEQTLTAQRVVTQPSWKHYGQSFQQTHRPVALLSTALDDAIWRGWPPGFAVDSLVYHLIVVGLVYRLCRRWLEEFPSLTAAMVVALHPTGAETVHYLLGRPDLLSVLWMLAALLAWTGGRSWLGLAIFYGAFVLALGAKETGVLLPFLALLLIGSGEDATKQRASLLRWLIAVVPAAIAIGLYLLTSGSPWIRGLGELFRLNWSVNGVAFMTAVTIQALKSIFLPVDLCPWYEGLIFPPTLAATAALLYLMFIGAGISAIWMARKRTPLSALGGAWLIGILLMIALRANTVPAPVNPLSVRWLYPGIVGLAFIIGGLLQEAAFRWPLSSRIIAFIGLAALIPLNWQAQRAWADEPTLFQRASQCNPGSASISLQHVRALEQSGEPLEAGRVLQRVIQAHPEHPLVISRQMQDAVTAGDVVRAILYAERLAQHAPSFLAYRTLGDLYALNGDSQKAIPAYQRALALNPRDMPAIAGLGSLWEHQAQWEQAIETYRQGLRHHPAAANLWFRAGRAHEQAGQLQQAEEAYQRVIQYDRYCPDSYLAVERVWAKMGQAHATGRMLERYSEITGLRAAPRSLPDPRDVPCGAESKIMYARPVPGQTPPVFAEPGPLQPAQP
ncbi:MAG: tetratricopeptide repeat protein [Nitrospirota bacterium]